MRRDGVDRDELCECLCRVHSRSLAPKCPINFSLSFKIHHQPTLELTSQVKFVEASRQTEVYRTFSSYFATIFLKVGQIRPQSLPVIHAVRSRLFVFHQPLHHELPSATWRTLCWRANRPE